MLQSIYVASVVSVYTDTYVCMSVCMIVFMCVYHPHSTPFISLILRLFSQCIVYRLITDCLHSTDSILFYCFIFVNFDEAQRLFFEVIIYMYFSILYHPCIIV